MKKIIILPCNGDSAAGKITWIATQEMVLAGMAEFCPSFQHVMKRLGPCGGQFPPLIIVDGCEKRCVFKKLFSEGYTGKHQLTLTDVGIEPVCQEDITRDDIELAKDAVIAECTSVDNVVPVLFSGCSCK